MSSRPTSRRRIPTPARLVGALVAVGVAVALVPVVTSSASAAPAIGSFTRLAGFDLDVSRAAVQPSDYTAFTIDLSSLRQTLRRAPQEAAVEAGGAQEQSVVIPDPDGAAVRFVVEEVPIMAPELAALHPDIHAYAGHRVDDPHTTVALDVSANGFHAAVRRLGTGSWYVDPAYNAIGTTQHLSYYVSDLADRHGRFEERELLREGKALAADRTAGRAAAGPGEEVTRRTFRVALVTDPAYATYFKNTDVIAQKATLMNRVNQIYNQDVALRMVLAAGSDNLNLDTAAKATGANGPCGVSACYTADNLSSCTSALLTRNQFVVGQLIGADNFDIGHIVLGAGGGGIAGLGVVGQERRAAGCTGLAAPTGDGFAIDFVAHEMGHEFAGNHTFNGANGSCMTTNRNGTTSVEPGSGTSVMAYAGICFTDDLQSHTDPYFSQRSIDEIGTYITAATTSYREKQTVTLAGFDADGESITLGYPGTAADTTIVRGAATYTTATVQAALRTLTRAAVVVTGYDAATAPGDGGFTVQWPAGDLVDHPRLIVRSVSGTGVTGYIGVPVNGGPSTNNGVPNLTGNHAPTVTAPVAKTIPIRTPFLLTGSAVDVDPGDQAKLTYLWEQNDIGLTSPVDLGEGGDSLVNVDHPVGPLFRVFGVRADVSVPASQTYMSAGENLADGNPSRSFPDMAQVLADNSNAETGTCPPSAVPTDPLAAVPDPYLSCLSEFLPTAAYSVASGEMNFRLTARDNRDNGGGVQHADVTLTVGTAGPFQVTSRNLAPLSTAVAGGSTETVTWDANLTNTATYATNVRILLSTDSGQTFPTVLAASTPNDGSEAIVLPNVATTKARYKIEAVGNYFFDTNDVDFTITGPAVSPTVTATVSASPTATTTVTQTVTPTPIATETATTTAGPTATSTVTETVQPTPTATATTTATVGPTATSTVTQTVQPTPTATATSTATVGPTATSTVTQTVQPTPTASETATVTAGPTATATSTATVYPTPTASTTTTVTAGPTATATSTATVYPTPTASTTTTVTAGPTATATSTATVYPTPTASTTTTVTAGPTATATSTATVYPTPTASTTTTVTAGPTATATSTATVYPTPTASTTTTVTGGPTATATTTSTVRPTPTATQTATVTGGPTATATTTTTVRPTPTATVTQTTTAGPTATTTVTQTTTPQPTVTITPTATVTAAPTVSPTPTPTVSPTATPVLPGTVKTATRIRLPNPFQKPGGKRVKLQFQVVGGVLSTGTAGTVLVRMDGQELKSYPIAVTRKQGKKVVGFSIKVPKGLSVGRHTFQVTFTPAGTTTYLPSRSRLITLTVLGPARSRALRVPIVNG